MIRGVLLTKETSKMKNKVSFLLLPLFLWLSTRTEGKWSGIAADEPFPMSLQAANTSSSNSRAEAPNKKALSSQEKLEIMNRNLASQNRADVLKGKIKTEFSDLSAFFGKYRTHLLSKKPKHLTRQQYFKPALINHRAKSSEEKLDRLIRQSEKKHDQVLQDLVAQHVLDETAHLIKYPVPGPELTDVVPNEKRNQSQSTAPKRLLRFESSKKNSRSTIQRLSYPHKRATAHIVRKGSPLEFTSKQHHAGTYITVGQTVLNVMLVILGFLLCFTGRRSVKLTAFCTGFAVGSMVTWAVAMEIIAEKGSSTSGMIPGLAAVGVGILTGALTLQLYAIEIFLIGAASGVSLGAILTTSFLYKIAPYDPEIVLGVSIAVMGLICGVAVVYFKGKLLCISTAFVGSYLFVRGFGYFFGGYPDSSNLANQVSAHNHKQEVDIPPTWWVYLSLTVFFCIVGMYSQLHVFPVPSKEPKEPKDIE